MKDPRIRVAQLLERAVSVSRPELDPVQREATEMEARTAAMLACRLIAKHNLLQGTVRGGRSRVVERVVERTVPPLVAWYPAVQGFDLRLGGVSGAVVGVVIEQIASWRWCVGPTANAQHTVVWRSSGLAPRREEAVLRVWSNLRQAHPGLCLPSVPPPLDVEASGKAPEWAEVKLSVFPSKFVAKCRCGVTFGVGDPVAWSQGHHAALADHERCVSDLKREVWEVSGSRDPF